MAETTGMLLGKFMPPHKGHQYLVDFARAYCDRLTVLVCSISSEPIPGELRASWMRQLFPGCEVVHVTDELPQEPADAVDFWDQWRAAIRARMPSGPDFVFASEDYGARLAQELGADFVPVDVARELVPVSATAIREDPMTHWAYIPEPVRPYFVKRVCIFGPECTGKTTLARALAARFETVWVHEYARPLLERARGVCTYEDIERIARGHAAAQAALARQANRVLFVDTDALTTMLWSETLFGRTPEFVQRAAEAERYDLTLLCDVDVPFVADAQRHFPETVERAAFMEKCRVVLEANDRRYVTLSGSWASREETAAEAVAELIGQEMGRGA